MVDQASGTGLLPDIRLSDMVSGVASLRRDAGTILRALPEMLPKPPTAKMSIGKRFQQSVDKYPDRDFLRFEGVSITYREANARANRLADFLTREGIGRGDVVAVLSRNHPDVVVTMLAIVKIGAICGMLNFNQRGAVLEHSLGLIDAKAVLYQEDLLEALESVPDECRPAKEFTFDDLATLTARCSPLNRPVTESIEVGSTAIYIFTSGTTGYPKASRMSHYRWLVAMNGIGGLGIRLRSDDVMYTALPFYHNNALTISVSSVLNVGACLAIGKQFSASRFFDELIENDATAFSYIGELCRYLLAQPPKPSDRRHRVRLAVGNGLRPEIWDAFTERFGIERIVELYAASEANIGFINIFGMSKTAGFSPLPYTIVEYDEETGEPLRGPDGRVKPVGKGGTGLLLAQINSRVPFDGYTDPKATEKKIVRDAKRKGDKWFNSGDVVRDQGFSHIGFVDRIGDTFRWKGENVATTEVEAVLDAHPGVEEAVVFGVPVPGVDGKAGMAAISLEGNAVFDADGLAGHVRKGLPAYAVPMFVRLVPQIEHTSTFKNMRTELRKQGYAETGDDPLYVLSGDTYVEFYPGFIDELSGARTKA
ncbi:long-chain-acyl-CoA synthetase [Gordonia sp. zg691]|uniref:Long-chain-acyl-CoA synthetase n=1 Tax=Gordonia jinghuaiqii TaxID=2758710 RepID=A0A7D7LWD9_9ACTN|nr:long-chain-acyl-CoA synthetase [Gordonia jinghuaiqii]MBD0859630.1 long-chain-acyl-CoA synthetase [Gordonia jinghuaiqii]MCR5976857.1 long-chain-acyl-CoA synthetase [Gordonia jinghuaiqii]QMT00516.1 long-chain-acyl-CoA synthetase [Gordonia jinghuaiqii]